MTRTGVAWFAVGAAWAPMSMPCATRRRAFNWQTNRRIPAGPGPAGAHAGNVTATQAMMLRLGQLQDQGLMHDEHASLAKAYCTVKCRETVWLCARTARRQWHPARQTISAAFVADAEAIYSYEGTREMNTLIVGKSITASVPSSDPSSR